jgi:hypothetical protein
VNSQQSQCRGSSEEKCALQGIYRRINDGLCHQLHHEEEHTALQDLPPTHLLQDAQDSCVLFCLTAGLVEEIILMFKAKEVAQEYLALACVKLERE